MEATIDEAIEEIAQISEKEENIEAVINKVNSALCSLNKIINWVKTNYVDPVAKKSRRKFDAVIEYGIFYLVLLATLSATLGYINFSTFNAEGIVNLALVLSTCVLVGVIKQLLWFKIESRDKTIKVIKEENKAKETALSVASIQYTKLQSINEKLIKYITAKDPGFNINKLYHRPVVGIQSFEVPKIIKPLSKQIKKLPIIKKDIIKPLSRPKKNDPKSNITF